MRSKTLASNSPCDAQALLGGLAIGDIDGDADRPDDPILVKKRLNVCLKRAAHDRAFKRGLLSFKGRTMSGNGNQALIAALEEFFERQADHLILLET